MLINATGSTPTWQKLPVTAPQGLPPGRIAHSAVYDPSTNRMVIFGGGQPNGFAFGPLFNDVWVLTNANGLGGAPEWVPRFPIGGPPAPREGQGAFYKQATNEMILFGGANNGIMSVPNDLWSLQNANSIDVNVQPTWAPLPQAGDVPGRLEHFASAYNPTSNLWTIALGCCSYTNATRALALNSPQVASQWTNVSPGSTPPPGGDAQNFFYDLDNQSLFVQTNGPGGWSSATWVLAGINSAGAASQWTNVIPKNAAGTPPDSGDVFIMGSAYNSGKKKFLVALSHLDALGNRMQEVWVLDVLGYFAASRARTLLGALYGYDGKGFDRSVNVNRYVDSATIHSGYFYENCDALTDACSGYHTAPGVDCSGLVLWSYNTAYGATTKYLDDNPITSENADGQYWNNTVPLFGSPLAPGDLLFFISLSGTNAGNMHHVAMYVGGDPSASVVESPDVGLSVRTTSLTAAMGRPDFFEFRRVQFPHIGGVNFITGSPVSLILTDPDGFTINSDTRIFTEREVLREIPRVLYYAQDSNNDDRVFAATLKAGNYIVKVLPKPGASPSDTYSLMVKSAGQTVVMAQNVAIANIPSGGYRVTSSGNAITSFTPLTATTTTLAAQPNPSNFGQSVTLIAQASGVGPGPITGPATGTVTFLDGGSTLGTGGLNGTGAATFSTSSLPVGNHSLTASYGGDAYFGGSTSSALTEQVVCGVVINVSPSTVARGGTITASSHVISCVTTAQTLLIQFSLVGPLQTAGCTSSKSVMFTTPPFTLAPNTLRTVSFPFKVPSKLCPGTYSITATTLVNGTAVNTSKVSLIVTP